MQTNELNEDSNSISIGFAPLQKRVVKSEPIKLKNCQSKERVDLLDHQLVVNITIITSVHFKSYQFRNQLKNYRYERKSRTGGLFNEATTLEEREVQQIFATSKDLFCIWRTKLSHKIFVLLNNGDLLYLFHKPQQIDLKTKIKKGGSFAILSCRKSNYSKVFDDHNILYEKIQKTDLENERFLLKNNSIQIFWKYLTNSWTEKPLSFEIIANFYFLNSCQILPLQNYNGKEQRPEFQYIARKKTNILGETEDQLYSLRIQGFWMKYNVQNLYKKLEEVCGGHPFEIDFQCHLGSSEMKQQCDAL